MAKFNRCRKRRITSILISVFILWSLSSAEAADDAAARAGKLMADGNYAAAVKILASAIKKNPLDQRLADMLRDSQRRLSEERARLKKEKAAKEAADLRAEANALYEKGKLDAAIRAWSHVLALDPEDDSSAWMIQKAQTRKQLDPVISGPGEAPRDYSKKIKVIADDITKLIAKAKEKLHQEGEERKRRELAALEEDAANERRLRLEEEQQAQEREEAFIAGTFKQGQELYALGKYDEAVCTWEAILPLLTQDSELKAKISLLCEMKNERAPVAALPETPVPPIVPSPEPVSVPAPVIAPVPEPIAAPSAADKEPVSAGPSRDFARIIIVIAAIMVITAVIWAAFYTVRRFTPRRRQPPVGKGFDPSKLASFLKKTKEDEHRDKDIFKVR